MEEEALNAQLKRVNEEDELQVKNEVRRILGDLLPDKKIEFGPVADFAANPGATRQVGRSTSRERDLTRYRAQPIPPKDPPTYIRIVNSEPISIWPGKRLALRIETDADDFFNDQIKLFITLGNDLIESGSTPLKGGRKRYFITFRDSVFPPVTTSKVEVIVELRRNNAPVLSSSRIIEIIQPPQPEARGIVRLPDFAPIELLEDSEKWSELGWNKETAIAEVELSGRCLVYWSGSWIELQNACNSIQRTDPILVQGLRTLYQAWICAYALLQYYNEQRHGEAEDVEKIKEFYERERLRASGIVLRLIEDRVKREWQARHVDSLELS